MELNNKKQQQENIKTKHYISGFSFVIDIALQVREYEDIQFLDHQLVAHNRQVQSCNVVRFPYYPDDQAGIIFPSLPSKPASDPAGAESRSKKQLGSSNRFSSSSWSSSAARDYHKSQSTQNYKTNNQNLISDPSWATPANGAGTARCWRNTSKWSLHILWVQK